MLLLWLNLKLWQQDLEALRGNYSKLQTDYDSLSREYQQYKADTAAFMDLTEAEQQAQIEIAKREKDISSLENFKKKLETDISGLQDKIDKLNADIIKISGQAKTYPAGYLTAGKDFPVGRYKIYGGSSNFSVHNAEGRLRLTITLGSGRYDVEEYIYTFAEGDEAHARSSFKMVPIE